MLIDATHAEETRVVVLDGSRLEDFDVETSSKRQLKGNIYLAKVVRVEPSLQAAFVEYGGNRHGFLAFAEIHPDYYQIPVADRQRLIAMELEQARLEEEQADLEMALEAGGSYEAEPAAVPVVVESDVEATPDATENVEAAIAAELTPPADSADAEPQPGAQALAIETAVVHGPADDEIPAAAETTPAAAEASPEPVVVEPVAAETVVAEPVVAEPVAEAPTYHADSRDDEDTGPAEVPHAESAEQEPDPFDAPAPFSDPAEEFFSPSDEDRTSDSDSDSDDLDAGEADGPPPETVGGGDTDTGEDRAERRQPSRFMRNYKIQEVIHRRQILLIQVVKEERGTKGAALTTYLSLAGRFSVLMPNSPRGGGISRKITSAADRRRLKEVMTELDIPRGMGMIVRTAGAQRPKPEIKRDCEYLLRLWDDIRELTMKSVAPALIYEEASLIKRAIRDVYSRDIDEILVDGEDGWRAAHDFMRMLMPTHAKKVQLWRDPQPLFARGQVEAQLDAMLHPIVQLRSGGYLVINQTEALVAIDVNSGRSTRERNIEETALRTNLEAADEAARQLRLRDLAGLIVIDFIDMESKRHNAMVERRIKEALKNDRARIQVGHISHFGLLEMSRQRLRPSLAEASFIACPHCGGTGHVRSTDNAAIHVLRGIEEEGGKRRAAEIVVHVATAIALYLLNHKRERLQEIEHRYGMRVIVAADDSQTGSGFRIDRTRVRAEGDFVPAPTPAGLPPLSALSTLDADDEEPQVAEDETEDSPAPAAASGRAETAEEAAERGKRRRRRRRRGRREDGSPSQPGDADGDESGSDADDAGSDEPVSADAEAGDEPATTDAAPSAAVSAEDVPAEPQADGEDDGKNRRRGRRGGRRKRRDGSEGDLLAIAEPDAEQPDLPPVPAYIGPTPANPFGGEVFDIFDVLEQAEQRAAAQVHVVTPAPEPMQVEAPVEVVAEPEVQPELAVAAVPEPATIVEPEPVAEPLPVVEPVPVAEPEPVAEAVPEPAPEPEPEQVSEPVVGPAIQPIVIGEAPPVEKKRGWWRR
jgi:ribonuclease E